MELAELIESLSLIGGQYHVDDANAAPAVVLLQRALKATDGSGSVTLRLRAGSVIVEESSGTPLVTHS
jgi:hypothetical protein